MIPSVQWHRDGRFMYAVRGASPRLLLMSGTHGDEFQTVISLYNALSRYAPRLPDFLYVPLVSPTAVEKRTRTNARGNDLNRNFFDASPDPEIQANIAALSRFRFDWCFSFHEDWEFGKFYFYDNGGIKETIRKPFFAGLATRSILPYSGVDDKELGFVATNGYVGLAPSGEPTGMFMNWSYQKGIVRHCVETETPGMLPQADKDFVASVIFEKLILPVTGMR